MEVQKLTCQQFNESQSGDVARISSALSDPARAYRPEHFLDVPASSQSGLYAWRADEEAIQVLSAVLEGEIPPVISGGRSQID
jgi:hypothetical protein